MLKWSAVIFFLGQRVRTSLHLQTDKTPKDVKHVRMQIRDEKDLVIGWVDVPIEVLEMSSVSPSSNKE